MVSRTNNNAETPTFTASTTPHEQQSNQLSSAISIMDIITSTASTSRLSAKGSEYIKILREKAKMDVNTDSQAPVYRIEEFSTDKVGCAVIVHEPSKQYFLLMFSETYITADGSPVVSQIEPARIIADRLFAAGKNSDNNRFKSDIRLVQTIVVAAEDYPLVDRMWIFIKNSFLTVGLSKDQFTLASFDKTKIMVSTNIEAVHNFIAQYSPHAVPQRADIGVLLSMESTTTDSTGYRTREMRPFMAITAYNAMVAPDDPMNSMSIKKYIPVINITDIVSSINHPALVALALPIAAQTFILNNTWLKPFTDLTKGKPNLGNLWSDATTGKPYAAKTAAEVYQCVTQRMSRPFLALEITEGRARPLRIDNWVFDMPRAIQDIADFLNTPFNMSAISEAKVSMYDQYNGTYIDNGVIKDTRNVDFLNLSAAGANTEQVRHFLNKPFAPGKRLEEISALYPGVVSSLYRTATVILHANLVDTMGGAISKTIALTYDTPQQQNHNVDFLLMSQANAFANMTAAQIPGGNMWSNPY